MGIQDELYVFFRAIWSGELVVMGYYFFFLLLRGKKWRKEILFIRDIIYMGLCGIYLFTVMLSVCDGMIRWYFIAGVVVGVWSGHTILCFGKKRVKNIWKYLGKC